MFAKLLKHEWKATSGLLGIFTLAAVGVSIVAAVVLRLLLGNITGYNGENEELLLLLTPVLTMLMIFLVLAVLVYVAATQFMLLRRFYKNKFTDEGYLTFTLPVNVHEIFLSSWLNMLIWTAISSGVAVLAVVVIALFGTAEQGLVNTELWAELSELFRLPLFASDYFADELGAGYNILMAINQIVQFLTSPVILMACITVGAVAAKKHKILMAIAIYYIYSMALSMGTGVVEGMVLMAAYNSDSTAALYISAVGQLVLSIASAVVGYFLSTYLMKNKLNLP